MSYAGLCYQTTHLQLIMTVPSHCKFICLWVTDPSPLASNPSRKGWQTCPMAINTHPPSLPPTTHTLQMETRQPKLEPTNTNSTLPHQSSSQCANRHTHRMHSLVSKGQGGHQHNVSSPGQNWRWYSPIRAWPTMALQALAVSVLLPEAKNRLHTPPLEWHGFEQLPIEAH